MINDYKCDICDKRLDLHKFQKIKRAPPILTLALFRIGYDYIKDERFKLTSRLEFPLELDMSEYFDKDYKNMDNNKYELYSVIVHRGNANQGHYFSYTRDLLKEGNHDLKPLSEFRKEPLIIEKVEEKKEDEEKKIEDTENKNIEKGGKKKGHKNNEKDKKENKNEISEENKKETNKGNSNQNTKNKEKCTNKVQQQNQVTKQKKNKAENQNQPSKKQRNY